MNNKVKMSDAEYQLVREDAQKVLETLSSESVDELRSKSVDAVNSLLVGLESSLKTDRHSVAIMESASQKSIKNPYKEDVKNYWLTQIANFIAAAIFKIPRELTPSVAYPWNAKEKAAEFDKDSNKMISGLAEATRKMLYLDEELYDSFSEIRERISSDDVNLINFCNSCENRDTSGRIWNISEKYKDIVELLYGNNISFNPNYFNTNLIKNFFIDKVSKMEDEISAEYIKAKEGKNIQENY